MKLKPSDHLSIRRRVRSLIDNEITRLNDEKNKFYRLSLKDKIDIEAEDYFNFLQKYPHISIRLNNRIPFLQHLSKEEIKINLDTYYSKSHYTRNSNSEKLNEHLQLELINNNFTTIDEIIDFMYNKYKNEYITNI